MWFGIYEANIGDPVNGQVRAAIVVSASYREWLGTASGWQHSDTRGGPRQAWAVTVPSSRYKSLARALKSKKKGPAGKSGICHVGALGV